MLEELTLVLVFIVIMTVGIRTLAHLQNIRRHGPGCRPCRVFRAVLSIEGPPRVKG